MTLERPKWIRLGRLLLWHWDALRCEELPRELDVGSVVLAGRSAGGSGEAVEETVDPADGLEAKSFEDWS
jgi:hypothetical protein